MQYLFLDTEYANTFDTTAKLCSFGYVLANEKFEVIESQDIFINPESEWDKYVLKDILAYNKNYYESFPNFKKNYSKIYELLTKKETIVFGHAIVNDVKAINDACRRYGLQFPNYKFYATDCIFNQLYQYDTNFSLTKISKLLEVEEQNEKHTSLQDAKIVYYQIKKMYSSKIESLDNLLSTIEYGYGQTINGQIDFKYTKGYENSVNNIELFKVYKFFKDTVSREPTRAPKILKGKTICITRTYERYHLREMMLIIQKVSNLGGKVVTNLEKCNTFVHFDEDTKNDLINLEKKKEVKRIEIISQEDFLKMIGFNEKEIEENYIKIRKMYSEVDHKKENTTFSVFDCLTPEMLNKINK